MLQGLENAKQLPTSSLDYNILLEVLPKSMELERRKEVFTGRK
jgi:hypothetical protein